VTAHGGSSGGRGGPGGGAEARDRRGGPGRGACTWSLARVGEPLLRLGGGAWRSGLQWRRKGEHRRARAQRRKGERRRARVRRRGEGGGDTPGGDRVESPLLEEQSRHARRGPLQRHPSWWAVLGALPCSPTTSIAAASACARTPSSRVGILELELADDRRGAPSRSVTPQRSSARPSSLSARSSFLSYSGACRSSSGRPPARWRSRSDGGGELQRATGGEAPYPAWGSLRDVAELSTTGDADRTLPRPLPCSLSPAATTVALSRQGREVVGAVHRDVWWALADPSLSPRYEGNRGRRLFPVLLQETAASLLPSKSDGKRDSVVLKETGAGGLIENLNYKVCKNLVVKGQLGFGPLNATSRWHHFYGPPHLQHGTCPRKPSVFQVVYLCIFVELVLYSIGPLSLFGN
jgi:hypothetical protein